MINTVTHVKPGRIYSITYNETVTEPNLYLYLVVNLEAKIDTSF